MHSAQEYSHVEAPDDRSEMSETKEIDDTVARRSRRYWATPTLMIASLIAGITLAVAHHFYYARLDNTLVGSTTRQQWPIRIGTAFAFLVKMCLANATGTAYIQWVWRRCRQQAIRIGAIDAAFSVDRNIFMLFVPGFVLVFPIAAGLVIILWCIPLSSVVTPATLGIASKPNATPHMIPVNHPSISRFDLATYNVYSRAGHSTKLNQMFTVLAGTGELLRLSAPEGLQNISYTVDIIVPLVRCQVSNETVRSLTAAGAHEAAIAEVNAYGEYNVDIDSSVFYAQNLTFTYNHTGQGQVGYYAMYGNTKFMPDKSGVPADIWIAIANPPNGTHLDASDIPALNSATYYTCNLRNASVTTDIAFVDNVQSLQASTIRDVEFSPSFMDAEGHYSGGEDAFYGLANYESYCSCLYSLLSGFALNHGSPGHGYSSNFNTTIEETIFGTASDFSQMAAAWKTDGLLPDARTQDKKLSTLIEEFSLNASWSLMSSPPFNNRVTTQVNQELWVNKYTYSPRNLYLAYGCSILACAIAVLFGLYAMYANGASNDTLFSSISRAMQSPDIAALFGLQTTNASALEKNMGRMRIQLLRDQRVERFHVDSENVAWVPV